MAFNVIDGEVVIQMEEFWEFVHQYLPETIGETCFGVPRFTGDGLEMVVNYAAASDCDPRSWAKSPACANEWKEHELKCKGE